MVPKESAGSLLHHADKFIVMFFLGPTSAGVYAVAYAVGAIFTSATSIFNSTLYPNIVTAWENEEFKELEYFYSIFLRWYVILTIPAIAGMALLSYSLLRFISTSTIAHKGAILLPILAIAFAFQGVEFLLSYPLQAAERTDIIALITIIAVIINIILNIAFIPVMGLPGAAIATLIAYGIRTAALYRFALDHLKLPIPSKGAAHSFLATVVMTAILFFLPVESWYWRLGLFPILGVFLFASIFLLSNGVRDEELDWCLSKLG
jgi:O-antigen/teichoic acid export membrane protein